MTCVTGTARRGRRCRAQPVLVNKQSRHRISDGRAGFRAQP
ncbi:hypothetical protein P376_3363 [Streptomyces sp. HCCB10043]|nr:hypothetical protein P376_3363 [Streptomyces sp. HCCB10043]